MEGNVEDTATSSQQLDIATSHLNFERNVADTEDTDNATSSQQLDVATSNHNLQTGWECDDKRSNFYKFQQMYSSQELDVGISHLHVEGNVEDIATSNQQLDVPIVYEYQVRPMTDEYRSALHDELIDITDNIL